MIRKMLNADFFRPHSVGVERVRLANVFRRIFALAPESRAFTISQCPVYLSRLEEFGDILCGDLVKMRVKEVATKGRRNGDVQNIDLAADESLTGHSAFLYIPRRNILCLERNRNGVGSGTLATYLTNRGGTDPIGMQLIIQPEALRRVVQMEHYRAVEVSIANFDNGTALARDVPSVAGGIRMARGLEAPSLHFKASIGSRRPGSLSLASVRELVNGLIGRAEQGSGELGVMKVTGRELGADEMTTIDLIKHRVEHEDEVILSRDHEQWYETRRDFVRRAWDARRASLIQICAEMEP